MAALPHDIRDILSLIVDSYCFRAKDIKKMDFFKLRLDRLLENAHERLATMESLLSDCWWVELAGFGACFHFNKTVAKQLVKLYAKLLDDLRSMNLPLRRKQAIGRMLYCSRRCRRNSTCCKLKRTICSRTSRSRLYIRREVSTCIFLLSLDS